MMKVERKFSALLRIRQFDENAFGGIFCDHRVVIGFAGFLAFSQNEILIGANIKRQDRCLVSVRKEAIAITRDRSIAIM